MAKFETTDASPLGIISVVFGLAVGAVLMQIVLTRHFETSKAEVEDKLPPANLNLLHQRPPIPEPRLQVNAKADLLGYRAQQKKLLTTYGWIDRKNGVVRIPIERAMEIFAHAR